MVRKDLVNTFVLKQDCLKVTLTTLLCKIYQTAPKLSAKEQDAARQTHASPSHDLKAGNLLLSQLGELQMARYWRRSYTILQTFFQGDALERCTFSG